MVFSSFVFLFYFLPLCLFFYYILPKRFRHFSLTCFSYIFYGWSNPFFMLLMLTSTLIDYVAGLVIGSEFSKCTNDSQRTRTQKIAVTVSIISNLILLCIFKYFNFAVDNYNTMLGLIGLENLQVQNVLRITLPLGISFYTFQSMSYTIDIYHRHAKVMHNIIDFACYVSMFPQLVAGPIIRFSEINDQLYSRTHTWEKFARGISFFMLGFAKKVLIANSCGKVADVVFDAGSITIMQSWYGVVSYAFQIYYDFSGYSDMAIGLGLMLGFMFPKNFDSPYISKSITEFWRRWHISLSSWLRDYLYIPLGGNKKGAIRTYVNLFLVMLIGGLWHGAAWNFVVWGGLHGILLAMERISGKTSFYHSLPGAFRTMITFCIVLFTWVFFRADSLSHALTYCATMLGLTTPAPQAYLLDGIIMQPVYLVTVLGAGIIAFGGQQTWNFTKRISVAKASMVTALFLIAVIILSLQGYNPFIYFIF